MTETMTTTEEVYLSSRFPTRETLEKALKECQAPDATRTQWVADCPRRAEYAIVRGLTQVEEAVFLKAGSSLHAGLDAYYTNGDADMALEEVRSTWGHQPDWRLPPGHNFSHLHLGHLEVIFKNYIEHARKRDTFRPIAVRREELNLENVMGAIWRLTPDGHVILGESKIVMEFIVNGESFLYSGKPDLPIEMGGAYYLLDHKSTNAYLSDWHFKQYRFSNQLRGYCVMIERLTGLRISGALINGIYMGDKAVSSEFKGNRFARYGPMLYQPGHLAEAIVNQYWWRKQLDVWKAQGYYPQHSGKGCDYCPFAPLCAASPAMREHVIQTEYVPSNFNFLSL